ncbi:DMT family transporter [Thiomicrorhabdus sp.]|uniref:DMT family transporter n=1 Tax=Thiomicrorhabdus sp. TaxID=2039724 RepID=UPI0029C8649F|nr:DMT family transporter [Thiomicrorhabdus sp.]
MISLQLLAILAGLAITVQATFNAKLGLLLKSSILATSLAFLFAFLFTLLFMLISNRDYPLWLEIKQVPWYLWFSGGALSAFGVGMFFYLIPKMGVGSMMSFALSGQIVLGLLASHYGWFDLPKTPITAIKFLGLITLIAGLFLINWESRYAA